MVEIAAVFESPSMTLFLNSFSLWEKVRMRANEDPTPLTPALSRRRGSKCSNLKKQICS